MSTLYGSFFDPSEQPVSIRLHSDAVPRHSDTDMVVPFSLDRRSVKLAFDMLHARLIHGAEFSPCLGGTAFEIGCPFFSTPAAKALHAVNCVRMDSSGNPAGSNTLPEAIAALLLPRVHEARMIRPVALVFGTGYAARAAVYAMASICSRITLVSRDPEPGNIGLARIEQMLSTMPVVPDMDAVGYGDINLDGNYGIVVNATPCGYDGPAGTVCIEPKPGQIYVDLPIGLTKSAFLPIGDKVASIDGMAIAAMAASYAYATMSGKAMYERVRLNTDYMGMARDIYCGLPEPERTK